MRPSTRTTLLIAVLATCASCAAGATTDVSGAGAAAEAEIETAPPRGTGEQTEARAGDDQVPVEHQAPPAIPIDGQCTEHALSPPAGAPRPGHEAAYEPDAVEDARADRLRPPPGDPLPSGAAFVEAQNPQLELRDDTSGTACAWQYVPSESYRLERVELHGTSSHVALLADACGRPGQALARGAAVQGQEPGWVVVQLEQPVDVVAGRVYWLWHSQGRKSIVSGGRRQVYWCNFAGMGPGGWEGPWRSFSWTARLSGTLP